MKSKKKKGFTLLEVIIAIAVLSIAMVGIASLMYFGANVSTKNTKKVNSSVFAGNIMQTYKSEGKDQLAIYFGLDDKVPDTNLATIKCYCYFDMDSELKAMLSKPFNEGTDPKEYFVIGDEATMISSKLAGNKKFGAYVEVSLSRKYNSTASGSFTQESGINFLKIYVKVINLKEVDNNGSELVFYLGR